MPTLSEGPGPIENTRDRIVWDREAPRWVIVASYAREKREENAQQLMEYLGEVKGYNVELIAVGQPRYGQRWDNYVLLDWAPPTGDPRLMSDRERWEYEWWHQSFALGFQPGALYH